jgi:hypothetical protein
MGVCIECLALFGLSLESGTRDLRHYPIEAVSNPEAWNTDFLCSDLR